MTSRRSLMVLATGAALLAACPQSLAQSGPRPPGARKHTNLKVVEVVFDKGLKNDWQDFGWADRKKGAPGPEQLKLAGYAGWILAKPGLEGQYGGLTFQFKAPKEWGDFLEVRVESERSDVFPRVRPTAEHRVDGPNGWAEVFLPIEVLNPEGKPFDRVIIRAYREVPTGWVLMDKVGLTEPGSGALAAARQKGPLETKLVTTRLLCKERGERISPLIYGIAYSPRHDHKENHQWTVGATARRWGGNPASRYNWEIGFAWNTGSDYYFRNVNYTEQQGPAYEKFLADNARVGIKSVLTVPMLGWVAKDISSASFPVDVFGQQQDLDPDRREWGNGLSRSGKKLEPRPAGFTSVKASPEFVTRWIQTIQKRARAKGERAVHMYILDNEPNLWSETHRDVFPEPLTYDELLTRTVQFGTAVRKADPEALIAGPAEWGWTNYFYSAADMESGTTLRPDRRKHGDVPLIPWYLRQLRAHEKKTGVKILDVLDLHFYPQAKGMGLGQSGRIDRESAAVRIRSTRALWDPSYKDESWIEEPVHLIPRMKQWVAENYPGLGTMLGEWNFGAEEHMSGGLAAAEALGRFGQQGLTAAFYWTYPARNSPAFWAFRAFRNYDGQGAKFLDQSVPTQAPDGVSLFASRDDSGKVVAVLLNLDPANPASAALMPEGCGVLSRGRVFQYAGGTQGFAQVKVEGDRVPLPPYSMTVVELEPKAAGR